MKSSSHSEVHCRSNRGLCGVKKWIGSRVRSSCRCIFFVEAWHRSASSFSAVGLFAHTSRASTIIATPHRVHYLLKIFSPTSKRRRRRRYSPLYCGTEPGLAWPPSSRSVESMSLLLEIQDGGSQRSLDLVARGIPHPVGAWWQRWAHQGPFPFVRYDVTQIGLARSPDPVPEPDVRLTW